MTDSIGGTTRLFYDTLDRFTNVVDVNGMITYRYNDGGHVVIDTIRSKIVGTKARLFKLVISDRSPKKIGKI